MSNQDDRKKDEFIKPYRKERENNLSRLRDYTKNYNVDLFMEDLVVYFEDEVDFNLSQIRNIIESPGRLENLIHKAKQRNTHPVTEFVQELFKDLGS